MEEPFDLMIEYKGENYNFDAALVVYGYTYKFNVEVNGHIIVFEADEEGNYRALINPDELEKKQNIEIELLKKIAEALEAIVK
jgi:hypothetical protein